MAENYSYYIDLVHLNGKRGEVVKCVAAATLESNREVQNNKVFFSCKDGDLAYLRAMLSAISEDIDISRVRG